MKQRNNLGFTVLELLLALLVIGVIGATAFNRLEQAHQNTRNKEREGDLKVVQLAIEAYYAKSGSYPKTADVENPTWVSANLPGVDNSLLTDPSGAGLNKPSGYSYLASKDGKAPCTDTAITCGKYALVATLEKKPVLELKSFN